MAPERSSRRPDGEPRRGPDTVVRGATAPDVTAAFAAETHRVMARRVPLGVLCFAGIVAIAGLMEVSHYPDRMRAFWVSLLGELVLCAALVAASRRAALRPWLIALASATTSGVAFCMTGYAISTGASADALAIAFIIFVTGPALLYPWGVRGQIPFVLAVVGTYVFGLANGVRGSLPLTYGLVGILGAGATSVLGAIFLEAHRGAIFTQSLLLEQARDRQLATLYDVSRTVSATLELPEVLRLVCRSVLGALGVDRLWLFWREPSDGDVHGLRALRTATTVEVTPVDADAAQCEMLLARGPAPEPTLRDSGADERVIADLPGRVVHLPLEFNAELVGVILADPPGDGRERSDGFLDLAATLGNTAAMAIGNARLHAALLNHRAELQRLSSQGLAMVEDILRRISRELHDNTCQALMGVKLDLALVERRFAGDSEALRGALDDIRQRLMQTMHDVREMSHLIYPPVLDDFGAVAAIESTAAKYGEASGIRIDVDCPDQEARFAPSVELLLFRVFQEAFTNVLKHAAATRVMVRLAPDEDAVDLEIADDGRGFDSVAYFRRPPPSGGVGLLGMRERVGHLGGSFHVLSRPGEGTRIVVRVPARPLAVAQAAAV